MAETDGDTPLFEVDLGAFGGKIAPKDFREFVHMADAEEDAWLWLTNAEVTDPAMVPMQTHLKNQLNGIRNYATQLDASQSLSGQDPVQVVRSNWGGPQPPMYHSSSAIGQAILAIGKALSPDDALLAFGLLAGQIAIDVRNPRHFRALSLAANPAMIEAAGLVAATEELLERTQNETRRQHRRQLQMIRDDEAEWAKQVTSGRRITFNLLKRHMRLNVSAAKRHNEAVKASIEAIENTRKAYEAQMQLKAAVLYWTEKSEAHGAKAKSSYGHLIGFIVGAVLGAIAIFWLATSFMLELSGVNMPGWDLQPSPGTTPAPATYFIVSIAVGTALTSLFWTARVLLRNYLTERHLERDAAERRVMTQTFLALIKEGAVRDEDRLVILNSLFRPSSDLPSKDEGPGEVALPALMARLLDQKR